MSASFLQFTRSVTLGKSTVLICKVILGLGPPT